MPVHDAAGGALKLGQNFGSGGFNFGDLFKSFTGGVKDLGGFFGSERGQGLLDLGGLALGGFGLNKSLGIADDQLNILKDQENRAATAQNFQTGNSLSLALQTTTPGTPEYERIKAAIANGQFAV